MKDQKKSEEIASQRVQSIAPLLQLGLDPATYQTLKDKIAAETGLSERTIRRYVNHYRQNGFSGLKPKGKAKATTNRASIPEEVLEQAIQLRREVPSRSIAQIIRVLEWEGHCAEGQIKRSTLQDQLAARGYSSAQMRIYGERGLAARRFQRQHRNELWQSDIKFGPHLKIGPKGESVPVYLVVFIDDATRFVVQASFFTSLEQRIVADAFRQAIRLHGAPDRVYFDNGKQYKSKAMIRTCSKLGVRLLFAKPYSPESKGKVERFNQLVDAFLGELALQPVQSLDQLNEWFSVWLSECYHHQQHSALGSPGEPLTPHQAFTRDRQPLRMIDPSELGDAFLQSESRRVSKAGCISFQGREYEVGLRWIGKIVEVVFDPADTSELTIETGSEPPFRVKPMVIGTRVGERPKLPEQLTPSKTNASRTLVAAKKQHEKRNEQTTLANSYRLPRKESDIDV